MKVLKALALDLGKTPPWAKVTPLADWGLELYCGHCGCTSSVKDRDLPKQQAAVRRWFEHHQNCKGKG